MVRIETAGTIRFRLDRGTVVVVAFTKRSLPLGEATLDAAWQVASLLLAYAILTLCFGWRGGGEGPGAKPHLIQIDGLPWHKAPWLTACLIVFKAITTAFFDLLSKAVTWLNGGGRLAMARP